jgi:LysM repeat protein
MRMNDEKEGRLVALGASLGAYGSRLKAGANRTKVGRFIMGNGAKIGLVGVLALIVLVVAVWDKTNEEAKKEDLKALPIVQSPRPADPRVRPLREPSPDDRVVGRMDHQGPLAVPTLPPRLDPVPVVAQAPAPPPPAPPAPPPAAPASKKYTIQAHDTLSSIAAAHYGNRGKWKVIYEANKSVITDQDRLPVGKEIVIPALAPAAPATAGGAEPRVAPAQPGPEPRATTPVPAGARKTHIVKRGETLSIIAEKELGARAKWRAIFEANRDKLPSENSLREGQELVIP